MSYSVAGRGTALAVQVVFNTEDFHGTFPPVPCGVDSSGSPVTVVGEPIGTWHDPDHASGEPTEIASWTNLSKPVAADS